MQGWKGKVRKNRLIRWFGEMDISKRYRIVFIALIFYTIVWKGTNIYFDTLEIDDNSARYLLSALVQSQAAIIAIVVTMTLVAVQLTASAYSPRVIDIFKNDRVMWLLLVWYGLSIFFGLFVLETIGGKYSNPIPMGIAVSLESCIFLAYLMGIAAFAGLFWHIGNVIGFLKPENVIKELSKEITKENVLKFIRPEEKQNGNRVESAKNDPVQPIVDVIHGSVMKYDIATTRYGLKAITEKAIEVIHSDYEDETAGHFCTHLERIGKLTVSREDGESVIKVLESLDTFGKSTAEKGLGGAASQAARSLGDVGISAAEKGLEDAASQTAMSLGSIGTVAAENELGDIAKQAVESLGLLGRISAENGLEDAARQTVPRLGFIGRVATKEGLDDAAERAASHLGLVGRVAAVNRFERVAKEAATSLGSIGKVAVEEKLVKRSVVMRAIESLGLVGEIAAEEGLKDATLETTTHLGLVGRVAAANRFGRVTQEAIKRLRRVGEIATKQGLKDATFGVASRFISIGEVATEKELDSAAHRAAECLVELTIANREIVENAIEFSGHAFEERNQKFLNLYEHELKEPHPRNSN